MSRDTSAQAREAGASGGGAPGRRAMVRWAWRLFRREWRQQLLVLCLIATAVAATILGAGIATNSPAPANAALGGASYAVTIPDSDPHLAADVSAIAAHFTTTSNPDSVQVVAEQELQTGSVNPIELRAENPNGPYGRATLSLLAGRYPAGQGEVALANQVASLYDAHIGGTWHAAGRDWRVVGLVENPDNLLDEFALAAPGQLPAPSSVTVLLDSSPTQIAAYRFPATAVVGTPPPAAGGFSPAAIVLVLAVFGLLFVGMVAVAGFTVLAQRRLRALGMVSALGATDRNVRLVMIANGAVVGVVATLVGAMIGFGLWFAYVPHLQASAAHQIDASNLPWWTIGAAMAFAVVTSVRAARRPARAIAEIPIVAALSGQPPRPKPAHRTAIPGAVLLAGGAYLLATAGGWGASGASATFHLLGGLVASVLGTILLGPLCIGALAIVGRRTSIAVRLALRDLARYRARSGAALSAISFAVLIAVLISLLAGARYSDAVDYFGPNLPSNELVVYTPTGAAAASLTQNLCAPAGEQQPNASVLRTEETGAHAIASTLKSTDVLPLETASGMLIQNSGGGTDVGQPYVATTALLAHYKIAPSELEPGAVLLTSRDGLSNATALQVPFTCSFSNHCPATRCIANPKIQTLSALPAGTAEPNLLLTTSAMQHYGLHATAAGWLIQAPHPLSAAEINAARQRASAAGLTIETKNDSPSLSALESWATAAGILLALGVLGMTVGLIRSETAGDLKILTAAGASTEIRRTLTATTAGGLGILGALIGTAVAYLAGAAYFHNQLDQRLGHVPVADLAIILSGLPAIAVVGGWLISGREPSAIARQPIE